MRQGQFHMKSAAIRLHVTETDRPALVFTNPLHQRQAEPEAFTPLLVTPHKGFEHRLAFLFGNAHAAVFHQEAGWQQGQADKAAIGVVQGIAQQVAHHRMQEGGIVASFTRLPRLEDQLDTLGFDEFAPHPDQVLGSLVAFAVHLVGGAQRQQPGLLDSGSFMRRQPALVYEPTRFDEYWIPEKDILTQVLEKAVEATTGTVEIPIPGKPGSKLVCTVSILAAGGGCGIRHNNDGYVVELDDPETLNEQEAAQCAAWWDQITNATSQAAWKGTRELYDFNCRKPLAKPTEVPAPKAG